MRRHPASLPPRSCFAGYRFPPEVIVVAVRWYLRYGLSYRDVEELLAERVSRSITSPSTDGSNGSRPLLADAARLCRHSPATGGSSMTYVKINGLAGTLPGGTARSSTCRSRPGAAAHRFFRRTLEVLKC